MQEPPHHTGAGEASAGTGEPPGEQRRDHVRVELLRRCKVAIPSGLRQQVAELVDLSGTGCGFLVGTEPQLGDMGTIVIEFEEWTLDAPIEVKYVRPGKPGRPYVGARFYGLSEHQNDAIVREVFATMRRQLRNTRGNT